MEQRARSIVTAVVDLAAFFRARLSEDEGWASAATPGPWRAAAVDIVSEAADPHWRGACAANASGADGEHIARHDPARVLREVTAKRAMVQHCLDAIAAQGDYHEDGSEYVADQMLRAIAAIWSDHPGYRAEWAPGHEES